MNVVQKEEKRLLTAKKRVQCASFKDTIFSSGFTVIWVSFDASSSSFITTWVDGTYSSINLIIEGLDLFRFWKRSRDKKTQMEQKCSQSVASFLPIWFVLAIYDYRIRQNKYWVNAWELTINDD